MPTFHRTDRRAGNGMGGRPFRIAQAGLLLLTLIAYLPVRHCRFTNFDDDLYVVQNPHVRTGLTASNVAWAFTSTELSNWHPLTWLSLQADATLFGDAPLGFHLVNVAWHAANACLLFSLLYRMTSQFRPALFAAGLFSLHPLHVESVAWISERKDVLSTFFWLFSTYAYVKFARTGSRVQYTIACLALAAGLAAKPMLVTLPLVLLLLDFWPLQRLHRRFRHRVAEKLPLFLIAGGMCVVAFWTQRMGGSVANLDSIPMTSRAVNAVVAYAIYLRQTVWPFGLAAFYPFVPRSPDSLAFLGSLLLLATLIVIAVRQRRSRPYLLTGWLWYLGTLVPVIGLVQVGEQAHADRYTYVPAIGLAIMMAWLMEEAATASLRLQRIVTCGQIVIVATCAFLTARQIGFWNNGFAVWQRSLDVAGPSAPAYFGLADMNSRNGDYEAAIDGFRQAIVLSPAMAPARMQLGWNLLLAGDASAADRVFAQLVRLPPMTADEAFATGLALKNQGDSLLATVYWNRAIVRNPVHAAAHLELAMEMLAGGQPRPARRHFNRVAQLDASLLDRPEVQAARRQLPADDPVPSRNSHP